MLAGAGPAGAVVALREQLGTYLDDEDQEGRDMCALLLEDIAGIAALPDLLMAAERDLGDDPYRVTGLIDDLISADSDGARRLLLGMVTGGPAEQCRAALQWLEPVARPEDVAVLAEVAARPDPEVRAWRSRPCPARSVTIGPSLGAGRALGDPDTEVRLVAIDRLAVTGRPDAVPPLTARAADPEPRVRAKVASALGRIGTEAVHPPCRLCCRTPTSGSAAGPGRLWAGSVAGQLSMRCSPSRPAPTRRSGVRAAKALGRLVDDDPRAEQRLRELAGDRDPAVRAAVTQRQLRHGRRHHPGRWTSLVTW